MVEYGDLAAFLAQELPEKAAFIGELLDEMGDTFSNYLLVSMLRDDLVDRVTNGDLGSEYVARFFAVMERLAEKGDSAVSDCVAIEIVESLFADDARDLNLHAYFGPALRAMKDAFEAWMREGQK